MAAIKFPSFPNVDFSKLDMSKFDVSKLPSFPAIDTEAVASAAKDAAYVTIGLGVLAFQKVQELRRELVKAMNDQYGSGKGQFDDLVGTLETGVAALEARFEALEGKLDSAVAELEKRLPERAGALLVQAHDAAKSARKQVRELIPTSAA
jgi:hypothetical protein